MSSKNFNIQIMKDTETFRGRNLVDLAQEFLKWEHGPADFSGTSNEILFLAGEPRYSYNAETNSRNQTKFNSRGRRKDGSYDGFTINKSNMIFLVAMSSRFFVDEEDIYLGPLTTIQACQYACRLHIQNTEALYCKISKIDNSKQRSNEMELDVYYIETPPLEIQISKDCRLCEKFEVPISEGPHYGVFAGYVCAIKQLPVGEYIFEYGGRGYRGYENHSKVGVIVEEGDNKKDFSIGKKPSEITSKTIYPMGFPIPKDDAMA
jgi:hypothetical protein